MKNKIVELIKLEKWNNVKDIIQKEKFLDDEVMGHLVEAHKWTLIRFFVENGGYLSQKIAISLAKSGQRDLIIFCIKKGAIGVFSQELLLVFAQTHQWKAMILAISKGGVACCYKTWLELAKSCQWYILEQCFKNGNAELLKSDEIEIIEAFESLLVNSGKENLVILYIEHFLFRKFSDDITSKEVSEMIMKARTFPFYKIFSFGKVWRFLTDNTLELIMFHGQWNSRPKATSSSTMVATIWLSGFWNTMPQAARTSHVRASSRVSMPQTSTVPSPGMNRALIILASVDLPEPFDPSTATNSPFSISKDTSLTALSASSRYW